MNIGTLLQERERLYQVIEEAKDARTKIKQLNTVIAMYGDQSNVSIIAEGTICTIPDCNNVRKTRGLCGKHYFRWRDGQLSREEEKYILPSAMGKHSKKPKSESA